MYSPNAPYTQLEGHLVYLRRFALDLGVSFFVLKDLRPWIVSSAYSVATLRMHDF